MPTMYSLRCLGETALRKPSGDLVHFRSRKHLALLLYLALNQDRAHRRERLAGLFWGESEDSRARHSLSQALYAVRRLLNGTIRIEGEDLELRPDGLWVDAIELEVRLESGDPVGAAELYRGPFLEGFWVRGARGFEEWADRERARLAALARDALREAIQMARDHCEWSQVCLRAERLVALDPFDEAAYGEWMRGLWMIGDRTGALDCYDRLCTVLADELEATPSPQIEELVARIRQRPGRATWDRCVVPEKEPSIFDNPPFVGRKQELAVLAEEWQRVKAGETRAVALVGEAGIGKTRLAREFIQSLELDDVIILQGRCYEAEQVVPYGPIAEALRCGLSRFDLGSVKPYWLAELARIVPETGDLVDSSSETPVLSAEGARHRLFEAIAQILRAASAVRKLVLFVDDFHWVDDASLALLHYILRRVENGFLLITCQRPEELPKERAATDLFPTFARSVRTIEVRVLGQHERFQLLSLLLTDPWEQSWATNLASLSGGNPFFAIELARSADTGRGPVLNKPLVPSTVKSLLRRRLARLDRHELRVIEQAAFLGSRFSYDSILAAVELSAPALNETLLRASALGLLTTSESWVAFQHDLIREAVAEQVSGSNRIILHARAAKALIRSGGNPGEIARHLAAADRPILAYKYAYRGARLAEVVFALKEAADLLELALQHAPSNRRRDAIRTRLGKLYWQMRQYERARPLLLEHLDYVTARNMSRWALLEARRDLIFLDIDSGAIGPGECHGELLSLYATARSLTPQRPEVEVAILQRLFWGAARSGNIDLADSTIGKIRALHEHFADPSQRWRTTRILGIHECYRGDVKRAENLLRAALDLAEEKGEVAWIVDSYVALSVLATRTMSLGLVSEILETSIPLADRLGDPGRRSQILCNAAVVNLYAGNLDNARKLLNEARDTLKGHGLYVDANHSIDYNVGLLALLKEELSDAESCWLRVLQNSKNAGHSSIRFECMSGLGLIALKQGNTKRARGYAAQALRMARGGCTDFTDNKQLFEELIARLRAKKGRVDKALARLDAVAARARGSDLPLCHSVDVVALEIATRYSSARPS